MNALNQSGSENRTTTVNHRRQTSSAVSKTDDPTEMLNDIIALSQIKEEDLNNENVKKQNSIHT